jgi:hypothetical protein
MATSFFYMSIMVSIFSMFDCMGYNNTCQDCPAAAGNGTVVAICETNPRVVAARVPGMLAPSVADVGTCNSTTGLFQARDDKCAPYGCFEKTDAQQCFVGPHLYYTLIALIGFGLYFPSATLTPFQVYFVYPKRDIRYPPLYVMCMQIAKTIMAAVGTLLTNAPYFLLSISIIINFAAFVTNWRYTVSNVMGMNHFKATYFLMSTYSAVVAIFIKAIDTDAAIDGGVNALVAGWVAIPLISYACWRSESTRFGRHRPYHLHQLYHDEDSAKHAGGGDTHVQGAAGAVQQGGKLVGDENV